MADEPRVVNFAPLYDLINRNAYGPRSRKALVDAISAWMNTQRDSLVGPAGPQGPPGRDGTAIGVPGPKGDKGEQGERGEKGDRGEAGRDGADSFVAGPAGPKGDPGSAGRDGIDGQPGVKGDPGAQGERGLQGVRGDTGQQGTPGQAGAPGQKGDRGDQGIAGEAGPQGLKGDKGDRGTPLKIEFASGRIPGALLLGASQNVTVNLTGDMGSDSYTVKLIPGYGLIGQAALSVVSKTSNTVTVKVTAQLALNLGAEFLVVAVA